MTNVARGRGEEEGVLTQLLAGLRVHRVTPDVSLAPEIPVVTLPGPAPGEGAGRVSGTVGPGVPALGLAPQHPISAGSSR